MEWTCGPFAKRAAPRMTRWACVQVKWSDDSTTTVGPMPYWWCEVEAQNPLPPRASAVPHIIIRPVRVKIVNVHDWPEGYEGTVQ